MKDALDPIACELLRHVHLVNYLRPSYRKALAILGLPPAELEKTAQAIEKNLLLAAERYRA